MAVKRKPTEDPDLNLTPIMNLVTILIPFLIMAAQFV
jgi:biopolymer transport protein ExbD